MYGEKGGGVGVVTRRRIVDTPTSQGKRTVVVKRTTRNGVRSLSEVKVLLHDLLLLLNLVFLHADAVCVTIHTTASTTRIYTRTVGTVCIVGIPLRMAVCKLH